MTYAYDPFDRLIERTVDEDGNSTVDEIQRFIHHGGNIVLVFDGSDNLTTRLLHGPAVDQLLAQEDVAAGETYWTLADNQNTIRDVADYDATLDETTVVNHLQYDSFGNITSESNPSYSPFQSFTGRLFDAVTGLYWYRARWYDPAVGRFLSEDPAGFAAGDANLARYVSNSPLNFVDPSGLTQQSSGISQRDQMYRAWAGASGDILRHVNRPPQELVMYNAWLAGNNWQTTVSALPDRGLLARMGDAASGMWNDAVVMIDQADVALPEFLSAVPETFADGRAADSMTGALDGLADTIVPFFDVPDIGPIYGNTEAYDNGRPVGIGWAIAMQAAIGGFAASSRAAQAYELVDAAAGMVDVGRKVLNGEDLEWTDAVAFVPAAVDGVTRIIPTRTPRLDMPAPTRAAGDGCFVAGTEVHLADESSGTWLVAAGVLGAVGVMQATRQPAKRGSGRRQRTDGMIRRVPDDNWAPDLPSNHSLPVLSAEELDQLCERLLLGDAAGMSAVDPPRESQDTRSSGCSERARQMSAGRVQEISGFAARPRRAGWFGAVLTLVLACACFLAGFRPSGPQTKPIDEIAVGERVLAENPTGAIDLSLGFEVDPETWRRIELRAPKRDGSFAEITLLRPAAWLAERDAKLGGTVHVVVPECGIDGDATVLGIGPCPPIQRGGGRVVTGVFRHSSAQVIDLYVDGLTEPIGTTANHPFWSEDRREFVRADDLRPPERLRTREGTTRVQRIIARYGRQPVYNIEVQLDHVYHVGATGILVHNGGLPPILCPDEIPEYPDGSFSIINWNEYPDGIVPRPAGPFRLLPADEYDAALNAKNAANRQLHRQNPQLDGMHIHEVHPVKFGGSPTDLTNKMPLLPAGHIPVTTWWNTLQRHLETIQNTGG